MLFDIHEVFKHTHPVLGAVSLVQLLEPFTGELVTFIAETRSIRPYGLTIFQDAGLAVCRLIRVINVAALTDVFSSLITAAKRAVHAAGCNHCGKYLFQINTSKSSVNVWFLL